MDSEFLSLRKNVLKRLKTWWILDITIKNYFNIKIGNLNLSDTNKWTILES